MSVEKYNEEAEKHLSSARDLKLVLEKEKIHPNYQLIMVRSIDLHKKSARRLLAKCVKLLKDEPTGEKKG